MLVSLFLVARLSKQIKELPDDVLSKENKDALRLILLEMEELRGAPKNAASSKIEKTLLWISDKGVDAIIAADLILSRLLNFWPNAAVN